MSERNHLLIYDRSIRQLNEKGSTTTSDGKLVNSVKLVISANTMQKLKKDRSEC